MADRPRLDRGLDLAIQADVTAEEAEAFREFYRARYGASHPGLGYFIDEGRPDLTKRYRSFAQIVSDDSELPSGYLWCVYYPEIGFESYIPRQVHMLQVYGYSRAQIVELYGVMFLTGGPRGAEVVARGLDGYDWQEPERPVVFPAGWSHDPSRLRTGLDFSTTAVLDGEMDRVLDWYTATLGEVPPYVSFLARHRPEVLKAYRNRLENLLEVLPHQFIPAMHLHHAMLHGSGAVIRENVLLARALGMTKAQTLRVVTATGLYGVPEPTSALAEHAGDLFDAWS